MSCWLVKVKFPAVNVFVPCVGVMLRKLVELENVIKGSPVFPEKLGVEARAPVLGR